MSFLNGLLGFVRMFEVIGDINENASKTYYLRMKHVVTGEEVEFHNLSEQALSDVFTLLPCYAWEDLELIEQKHYERRRGK